MSYMSELNDPDVTQGYQVLSGYDRMFNLPAGKDDCEVCEGSGDVQCSRGEAYYYDDCHCVMLQYWEDKGNEFMADGYRKMLANVIKLRNL